MVIQIQLSEAEARCHRPGHGRDRRRSDRRHRDSTSRSDPVVTSAIHSTQAASWSPFGQAVTAALIRDIRATEVSCADVCQPVAFSQPFPSPSVSKSNGSGGSTRIGSRT